MKTTITKMAGALLLFTAASTSTFAQPEHARSERSDRMEHLERRLEQLDLTEEQSKEVREQMEVLRLKMQELRSAHGERGQLRSQINEILTEEQRAEAMRMRELRREEAHGGLHVQDGVQTPGLDRLGGRRELAPPHLGGIEDLRGQGGGRERPLRR